MVAQRVRLIVQMHAKLIYDSHLASLEEKLYDPALMSRSFVHSQFMICSPVLHRMTVLSWMMHEMLVVSVQSTIYRAMPSMARV